MAQDNIYARMRNAQKGIPAGNTYALLDDDGTIGGLGPFKKFYLDAVSGVATNGGKSPANAVSTLAALYALLTEGDNDTGVVIGDGGTAASVRLSTAFVWDKDACNLVGITAPSLFSQRARIATLGSATAVPAFFTIASDGGLFANLSFVHDYDTDGDNQICLTLSGNRNVFQRCHFYGIAKGSDAGGRVLKITGQENLFEDCVIGVDTIDRSAANVSVEFASGAARNVFRNCIFPIRATATSPLGVKVAAAAGSDRFQVFENCIFWNHGTSVMSGLATLAASMGGYLLFKNCTMIRITEFGTDATSLGQIYVDGASSVAATSSIAVIPT